MRLLLLATFIGVGLAWTIQDCPTNLKRTEYLKVFGNSCFQFNIDKFYDFEDAEDKCENLKGKLAMPKNKDINNFLLKSLNDYSVKQDTWIGLTDRNTENKFEWVDGESISWQNFGVEEGPRGGFAQHHLEDCTAISPAGNGTWHDYHCSDILFFITVRKPYICQFDVDAPLLTTTVGTTACSIFNCDLDCGLDGYKTEGNCLKCECEEDK